MREQEKLNNTELLEMESYVKKEKENDKSPFSLFGLIVIVVIVLFALVAIFTGGFGEAELIVSLCASVGLVFILIVLFSLHFTSKDKDDTPFLVSKKDTDFMIVDELDNKVEERAEVKVRETIKVNDNLKVKQTNKRKDKKIEKVFKNMASTFNEFFKVKGYETRFGNDFISAMQYSRLIILKNRPQVDLISNISNAFNVPSFIISKDDYEASSIANEPEFVNFVKTAMQDDDRPHFIYIDNIKSREFSFIEEIREYFIMPTEVNVARDMVLPNNLWFVVLLDNTSTQFDIDRNILKYSYVTDFNYYECGELDRDANYIDYSIINISRIIKRTEQHYFLSEDLWKKFDNLIGIIQNLNEDYFVDNKIIIRLENYLLSYLECEDEKHQVDSFDFAISRTVLNDMLLEGNPNTFINQNDLFAFLETNFEGRDLYEFEAVIKSYYMLYDTEGNRHYE